MKKAGEFLTEAEAMAVITRMERIQEDSCLGMYFTEKDIFSGKFVVYWCD